MRRGRSGSGGGRKRRLERAEEAQRMAGVALGARSV